MTEVPRNTILRGSVTDRLAELPADSVDCIVTSPPYFQLRDYGVAGQIGLEATVDEWVTMMRRVCSQLSRVLKPRGVMWLNLGDSYSRQLRHGAPAKGLFLAPERLLLALAADGWIVRNKVIWAKPNPLPHSVADRLNTTHEVVYFLVRSPSYYFDLNSIREPYVANSPTTKADLIAQSAAGPTQGGPGTPLLGKNPGDVWTFPTRGYAGAHFATFPAELVRRPIRSTCPEAVCTACGEPWTRSVEISHLGKVEPAMSDRYVLSYRGRWRTLRKVGELIPCGCGAPTRPGIVLDPFFGTGTAGEVARQLGRDWIGVELNDVYIDLALERLRLDRQAVG